MKTGPKGPSRDTEAFLDIEADALIAFVEREDLPLLETFTYERGYYPEAVTAQEFAKRSEKFAQAIKMFKAKQKSKWILASVRGEIETAPSIFTLKNISDMRDTHDIRSEHTERKVVLIRNERALLEDASHLLQVGEC